MVIIYLRSGIRYHRSSSLASWHESRDILTVCNIVRRGFTWREVGGLLQDACCRKFELNNVWFGLAVAACPSAIAFNCGTLGLNNAWCRTNYMNLFGFVWIGGTESSIGRLKIYGDIEKALEGFEYRIQNQQRRVLNKLYFIIIMTASYVVIQI